MDTTLVINPGSASKKYALYQDTTLLLTVLFERTGEGFGKCVEINGTRQHCEETTANAYHDALRAVLEIAVSEGTIQSSKDITRVGMRIVAPGSYFGEHRIIDTRYEKELASKEHAAPLHIPAIRAEIAALKEMLPHALLVGASDSAFHTTIPEYARAYSIPREDTKSLDIHRFGYHGLSLSSVMRRVNEKLGDFPDRTVVCHVGSGVSVTALQEGKSVDTTMGYGPGSGLMMNTRAGDIDPAALLYLMLKKKFTPEEAEAYVSEQSGLLGLLGVSDMRIALERRIKGEREADEAISLYMRGIKKAIGSSVAVLGGIDLLILTATAAERNPTIRTLICENLQTFGLELDGNENDSLMEREGFVSTLESKAKILVVHTNEMREIAHITSTF